MLPDEVMSEMELQKIGHVDLKKLHELRVEEDKIPDWVFDVHTLKGKHVFKRTELDMVKDEEKALKPHQYSMFDYGDWNEYFKSVVKCEDANKLKEFQQEMKQKQKENGTEDNFERV